MRCGDFMVKAFGVLGVLCIVTAILSAVAVAQTRPANAESAFERICAFLQLDAEMSDDDWTNILRQNGVQKVRTVDKSSEWELVNDDAKSWFQSFRSEKFLVRRAVLYVWKPWSLANPLLARRIDGNVKCQITAGIGSGSGSAHAPADIRRPQRPSVGIELRNKGVDPAALLWHLGVHRRKVASVGAAGHVDVSGSVDGHRAEPESAAQGNANRG